MLNEEEKLCERKEKDHGIIAVLNRYSLIFHALLACGVCFLIEWISRHSFVEACYFVVDRNLVFLYNSLIVYASLMLVYIVKRRALMRMVISTFWLFLGTINGCILAKRVSPFSFTDLKMVGDLFTMQSNYFTATEAVIVICCVAAVVLFLVVFWFKGPQFKGKPRRMVGVLLTLFAVLMLPQVTDAAVSNHVLTAYFENLAQGYKDYGFVYSFSASVLDRGMSTPDGYSEEAVDAVLTQIGQNDDGSEAASLTPAEFEKTSSSDASEDAVPAGETAKTQQNTEKTEEEIPEDVDKTEQEYPNIICILLESFVDPEMITFLETSEDPIPNFHNLYENYTSGYLEVPVVGAGTANTEFEILTGMGMQFFGLGEYPYKTILKETNCESIASDLRTLGYGSHVVHNNGGNFYSRANAFSMMGFDTFTSKELMDIREYTPLGTWPTDHILIGEVEKSLDYTPDQQDFVYTITVGTHGDYPREQVLENPEITVTGPEDEGERYAWEYYVNMLHETDNFIGDLIEMLSERDEKTIVIMFGDHLPTMGLTEEDMTTGSLFQTQYATWNNFGLEKEDKNMTSYQLLADMLDDLGIHTGTMFTFHQNRDSFSDEEEYQKGMELLQYDILYGEHYCYGGENPYPATDLVMGTQEVVIERITESESYYYIRGENFTKWSKAFINDKKVSTSYISSHLLRINKDQMPEGMNTVVVNQMGSSDTIFRSSNQVSYYVK
ncbi:MAG: LTA synthase family protein [Candidatus Choladocola sp.]|nr:LTA synthase family protein [Candidatus Choladocola sp.]